MLTGMQLPEVSEIHGIQKRCNNMNGVGNMKISFKFKTAPEFTTKPYFRQFFKMAQTSSQSFPADARPALSVDAENRILLGNNPFLTVNNRWTTSAPHFYWPVGMMTGYGEAQSTNTDTGMRVEADKLYDISIEWQVVDMMNVDGSWTSKDEIIFTINDSVTVMDFSFGDYFCHQYMDMLLVFGETVENHSVAGFKNVEGVVSDVKVAGLCPVPEAPIGQQMCC